MNAIEEFEEISGRLKRVSFGGFDGYRVDKILTIPTQEVLKGAFNLNIIQFFKSLLGTLFRDGYQYTFESVKDARVVFFYSHTHALRKDYVHFMETVASCTEDAVLFSGKNNPNGVMSSIKIRFSSIKMIFLLLLWMWQFYIVGIRMKYWKKFLTSLLASYKWKCLLIKNKELLTSISSMVSIFDAREFENVFAQFLSHQGIPTATLQHGHYGSEFYYDSDHFYIGIGYRGFVSDYFLLWGDTSYKGAVECGIPKARLIKVGNPYLIVPEKVFGARGTIGVLFDGGDESIPDNKQMYSIAKRFAAKNNKKLLVKLHPSYKTAEFTFFMGDENVDLFSGDLKTFAESVEMTICCNTSCLITLLIWECKMLHYAPSFMIDVYEELQQYSFSNYDELVLLDQKDFTPSTLLSLYSEIDNVKDNYRNAINRMITINNN